MGKDDKRRGILDAAEKMLRNRRIDEVTLDAVAAEAHVGKGTIYLYFRDKEDLFFQMVTDGFESLRESFVAIAASRASVQEKLCSIGQEMSAMFKRKHALFRMILSPQFAEKRPGSRDLIVEHHRKLSETIKGILNEGVEQGVIRRDVDLDVVECAFLGAMKARDMRLFHMGIELSIESLVDLLIKGASKPR